MDENIFKLKLINLKIFILQSHNDALDDHERIPIAEYMREHRKIVTRYCDKHRAMVLSLGCRTCLLVFCNHCVSEDSVCASGEHAQGTFSV